MRFALALALLLVAPALQAQSAPSGSWVASVMEPGSRDRLGRGTLELGAQAGRFEVPEAGWMLDLVVASADQAGEAVTLSGTYRQGERTGPFTLEGRMVDGGMGGTLTAEGLGTALLAAKPAAAVGPPDTDAGASGTEGDPEEATLANVDLFEPFPLPTPNRYRSASGRPGPDYWQQQADYQLVAELDTTTHTLTGTVTLTYTNNSPEALDFLWFHLEQNLFNDASRGVRAATGEAGSVSPDYGYRIGRVEVDGRAVTPHIDDTRMRVTLPEPVEANGGRVEVTIPYTFVVPEGDATPRMGRLETRGGTVYSFAQWFPRVAVFDDVNGWNTRPYLGAGEFYLNFGDYELELTVPAPMTLVATGEVTNPGDVYTAAQRDRIDQALGSDERVYIVRPEEVGTASARPSQRGTTTWRFEAERVRDVAWGASAAFILDGARAPVEQLDGSELDVLILSAYPHEGVSDDPNNPGWEEATRYGRASIVNNSRWYPYPYPVAISVASHVGGMEYPMLHFSSVGSRHFGLFGVIDHELGHNWFPMIVGSDERRHAWMDEGFNTFINYDSNVIFYDEGPAPSLPGYGQSGQSQYVQIQTPSFFPQVLGFLADGDRPILREPDRQFGSLGWNAYFKPAIALGTLRNVVLPEGVFDEAFRAYIRRWALRHPQPADFFRTIEDVSGEELDWFWRGWFATTEVFDAALTEAALRDGQIVLRVENRGGLVLPVTVAVTFADGSEERATIPFEAFFERDDALVIFDAAGRTPVSATLDPDSVVPDADPTNNGRRF